MNALKFQTIFSYFKRTGTSIRWCSANTTATDTPDVPREPLILSCSDRKPMSTQLPRQAWIQSLDSMAEKVVGMTSLHPDVFGVMPRIDIICDNLYWQRNYRYIEWRHAKSRTEMPGGGRKPWPQKGTGRARAGSVRAPHFYHGGKVFGPRRYDTKFFMIRHSVRVQGLISTISCKFIQDDLKIVENLEIPSDDPKYISDLVDHRKWGPAVLFVDVDHVFPENISLATEETPHLMLIPLHSLNVYSMLKFDTMVLTTAAAKKLEEILLYNLIRPDMSKLNECSSYLEQGSRPTTVEL